VTDLESTVRGWFETGNVGAIVGLCESLKAARDRAEATAAACEIELVKLARQNAARGADGGPAEGEPSAAVPVVRANRPKAAPPPPRQRHAQGVGEAIDR
jgi:hypothetical protein